MIRYISKSIVIVGFWILVLFAFLYSPAVIRWFSRSEKSITVFTWPLIIDANYITAFEKETGIKVYISYYESNEELLTKLKTTGGRGYDLVIPSDYTVEQLIKEKLVKKVDRSKLDFIDRIYPFLKSNYYDPTNEYSLPYFWSVYGLGIDRDAFGGELPEATWALIFEKEYIKNRIGMTDSAREAIMIATQYLYGSIDALAKPGTLEAVQQILLKQKQWVEVYSDVRSGDLLASKSCAVVAALSPDITRLKKEYPNISFVLPKEGSFMLIDAFLIPVLSQKDELTYQFLNYLYRPEVVQHNIERYGFCSPVIDVKADGGMECPIVDRKNLEFFRSVIPEFMINDIWVNLMAH
jgi:spermidine/putrescine transport system substrate-binding protein